MPAPSRTPLAASWPWRKTYGWLAGPALAVALALSTSACYQRVVTGDPVEPRSEGPWSVEGIRIGMTWEEARDVLGPSLETIGSDGRTHRWGPPKEVHVTFNVHGRAVDIVGNSLLDLTGRTVVWSGAEDEQVVQALGEGRVTRHYRPSGSGVISLGRELAGSSREYTDDVAQYTVSIGPAGVGSIRALPKGRAE